MPISSTLAARLGTGPARAPAPARWSPYARSSVPEPQGGRGGAKASRPPLRLDPATARLLGPAQKVEPSGSRSRPEPAAPGAASAAPAGRSRGGEMTSPEPVLKPKPDAGYDTPPVEKRRCSGKGGFVSSAPSLDTQRSVLPRLSENSLYNNAIAAARFGCNSGRAFADRDLFLR